MQVLSLAPEAVSRGLVTCSTGNHALAFLHACSLLPQREGYMHNPSLSP